MRPSTSKGERQLDIPSGLRDKVAILTDGGDETAQVCTR
jgi:hypothetical protein